MFLKRDPGPCPIDDAPHTTCCAPTSSAAIVAGPITPATSVTVRTDSNVALTTHLPPVPPDPPATTFTTTSYRTRIRRPPAGD
jgi:hypothetical protein